MAKVLLVEDDNNLREIYQARLTAEGYDIVTAQNGEEALVVAKQNKPDLIISDVMMPRISGFEMLDILRNTEGIKHTKVIMLTALGQNDDQERANSLGADRYLVKSQVTLEDIVNAAKELLEEDGATMPSAPQATTSTPAGSASAGMVAPAAPETPAIMHVPDPGAPKPVAPTVADTPVQAEPVSPAAAPASPQQPTAPPTPMPPAPLTPATPPTPPAPDPVVPAPTPEPTAPQPTAAPEPAATPPSGPTTPAPAPAAGVVDAAAQGLEAEEAALQAQIDSYSKPAEQPAAIDPAAANNDQAIADAVKELNSSTADASAVPPSASAAPTPSAPETPPAEPAADASAKPVDDTPSGGKKIIQPISDPAAKPDLNALLAKEEAKGATSAPPAPIVNGVPAPAPGQTPPPTPGQPFDPNTSL